MAFTRVCLHGAGFLHHHETHLLLPFLGLHSGRRVQLWRNASVTYASVTYASKRRGGNLKTDSKKTAPSPNRSPSSEYLKRRTRSGVEFDRDYYLRYAASGHVPVMFFEVLEAFRITRLCSFVDCTLGAAGHSSAIIDAHRELELFVGLDMDPLAHDRARARIETALRDGCRENLKVYTHVKNFKYIKTVLDSIDHNLLRKGVDGIFMDLGISSMQVDHSERGFSLLGDGPLDMRMNPQRLKWEGFCVIMERKAIGGSFRKKLSRLEMREDCIPPEDL